MIVIEFNDLPWLADTMSVKSAKLFYGYDHRVVQYDDE